MLKLVGKVPVNDVEPYWVYGIAFKTIHDDSSYYDDHEIWFKTDEELRDKIFGYWGDEINYKDLSREEYEEYGRPGPNYDHSNSKKISKISTAGKREIIQYRMEESEYKDLKYLLFDIKDTLMEYSEDYLVKRLEGMIDSQFSEK